METSLQNIIKPSPETGLMLLSSYLAPSGFNHKMGYREMGKLRIIEGVAEGTSCILLSSIRVYDEKGNLVLDPVIKKNTYYSRETVLEILRDEFLKMLKAASEHAGKEFDYMKAYSKINEMLTEAYFRKSFEAIIDWALETGII